MPVAFENPFSPTTSRWFGQNFSHPTPVQAQGWPVIARGEHTLLLAPTGSGKTLAAFLWGIDQLISRPRLEGTKVLYVSPLKALVYDVERNLRAPLVGVTRGELELEVPSVAIRTGDTSQKERNRQLRHPGDILVTTPESLYLLLGSRHRQNLVNVHTVILDEIHVMAGSKRGVHLALSLERLVELCSQEPQRIGLSATVKSVDQVARFLGGHRPVTVVDTAAPPRVDLRIVVPVEDMENPPATPPEGGSILGQLSQKEVSAESSTGIWPSIYPELLRHIQEHRSTIIFVNSRGLCERLALRLNELAESELVLAHHGSVSHDQRSRMEEMLKSGELKGIVATSSLELGIDMGAVDLVILVESPGSVARGLQRVGRAGHQVGAVSVGKIFPKFKGDLLECAVVSERMLEGVLEPIRIPKNPLDVLAQQIVAICSVGKTSLAELEALLSRTAHYQELSRELLEGLLDMLSGRFPSTDFAELKARINWDRESDTLEARPGSKQLSLVNAGTIPDRGLYSVHIGQEGSRIGELDEEMVHEVRPGQNFTLGASTWRIQEITRDRVIVSPAPGEPGRMPFWHGDGPGRPIELGRALGAFLRRLEPLDTEQSHEALRDSVLDELARGNLVDYVQQQKAATERLPTDRTLVVERFRDELGDWRVCILSPLGSRVHAPWALAIEARLGEKAGFEVQTLYTDDGIVLRIADSEEVPDLSVLFPSPDQVEDLILDQVGRSAVFASNFRENAGRALLLPRNRPGKRTPLWAQRLRAQNLLAVARDYPNFPIILETYRTCLQDIFDVPSLKEVLQAIQTRRIRVVEVETPSASPFARALVFAYVAEYLYEGDSPLAERKAQALTLDRNLLRDLLGQEELRDLLDPVVLDELEAELGCLTEERRARSSEGLVDLLRRLGDLTREEILERSLAGADDWLTELERARRVVALQLGGQRRWVVVEDAALYRDALGAVPPGGLPEALLGPVEQPLRQLVTRYARTHGPFVTRELSLRYQLGVGTLEPVLRGLVAENKLLLGEFRPFGREREWCDPEVLRRLRRRTLAKLRNQVAPVDMQVLGRFLGDWHSLSENPSLEEVVTRLEGLPLPFSDLENSILPARISGYRAEKLDELTQLGMLVWVGHGSLGARDGKIALYRRDRVARLLQEVSPQEELGPLHQQILACLRSRGASFFYDLLGYCGNPKPETLLEAVWDLVWMTQITNDSFLPLRQLARPPRRRRGSPLAAGAGRWVLVEQLLQEPVSDTERLMSWGRTLLERYGVVSREVLNAENLPGGFTPLYQTYKALEDRGQVRRGYFVEGLSGAQFSWSGTVDRLRNHREESQTVQVLATLDPANPYGSLLPWPENEGRPRRAAGTRVILVDGELVFFVERGAKKLTSFPRAGDSRYLRGAMEALRTLARERRGKMLRILEIDGQRAREHRLASTLLEAGFIDDYTGLSLTESHA